MPDYRTLDQQFREILNWSQPPVAIGALAQYHQGRRNQLSTA
jgi:hypothetical protein